MDPTLLLLVTVLVMVALAGICLSAKKKAKLEEEAARRLEQHLELARKKFKDLDADGNGALEKDEIVQLVRWNFELWHVDADWATLSEDKQQQEVNGLMSHLDDDGNGELSFEEFKDWFTKTVEDVWAHRDDQHGDHHGVDILSKDKP